MMNVDVKSGLNGITVVRVTSKVMIKKSWKFSKYIVVRPNGKSMLNIHKNDNEFKIAAKYTVK